MTEQDTRTQILMAATAVFAEKGFAKASMNDIVRASGLSKGGVYWHFKSKDELVTAVFDAFFAEQIAYLDAILAGEGTAQDKLLRFTHESAAALAELAAQFPSSLEFYALAARHDSLREELSTYFYQYQERITGLITQGIAAGEWRSVPAEETARTFISLFEGALLVWSILPEAFALDRQLETAVTLLLNGLQSEEKPA
ncbi:MAG TPA: TetR/AcrR family transcriptional regulator [Anaerolineae bacterium]|nr:TetR/AcrR family transcriptional regulator [Anaerolineae bacterium]